jgi:acyl-CoA synthetase (NDP forming)
VKVSAAADATAQAAVPPDAPVRPAAAPLPVARLIRPQSIAIVGISPEPSSHGAAMLKSLASFDYSGAIHLVSRNRREAFGRPCAATIDDLPMGIDLAVLCVPRAAVLDAVAACGRRRIGGAIVYASGFAETGAAGLAEQNVLADLARRAGIALLGPNCLGYINHVDGVALCLPLPEPRRDKDPSVGFLAQSGAMMLAACDLARAKGFGFTQLVSTGNEAVIGVEDFLAEMIDDDATRVILLFMEEIRRPALFLELAARARERRKPIVMFHSGRTAAARAAARTHTGALAGDFRTMATLTAHQGVIHAGSFDELLDIAALLVRFPDAPVAGVGVITNSGAFLGMTFDICADERLAVPALSPPILDQLAALMPDYAAADNPLDLGTQLLRTPQLLGTVTQSMLDDPDIGSVVLAIVLGSRQQAVDKARAANAVLRQAEKPAAFGAIGGEAAPPEFLAEFADGKVALFPSAERALRAMARITHYGLALRRWQERRKADNGAAGPVAGLAPQCAPPPLPGRGVLPEYLGKVYLAALGVPVPQGALASNVADALAIADRIGFPVAMKAQAAALAHKSEAGGVRLGIADAAALRQAWYALNAAVGAARPDVRLDGVLVERMSPPGIEMIVGARRDPQWGPVIAMGFGGVRVELLDDVRLLAPDVTEEDILNELGLLRAAKCLHRVRGALPADTAALAAIILKVAVLMRTVPDIIEIDLNPIVVHPQGQGACALDALVVLRES